MQKEIVCFAIDSILIENMLLLQILVNMFLRLNPLKNTGFITQKVWFFYF